MIKITTKQNIIYIIPLQKIFGFRISGRDKYEINLNGQLHEITEDEYNRVLLYWEVIW